MAYASVPSGPEEARICSNEDLLMPTVSRPTPTIDGTLRVLRQIDACLIFAALLEVWLPEGLIRPAAQSLDQALYHGLGIVALLEVGAAFVVRNRMLPSAIATLRSNPIDPHSIGRWRAASIASYALAVSVVLYGLVLRMMGATFAQGAPLYAVGLALLILWWPRRP
jgi:hypothetical protein